AAACDRQGRPRGGCAKNSRAGGKQGVERDTATGVDREIREAAEEASAGRNRAALDHCQGVDAVVAKNSRTTGRGGSETDHAGWIGSPADDAVESSTAGSRRSSATQGYAARRPVGPHQPVS